MAAEHHFVYTGGGRDAVPREATRVTIHDSFTVIPEDLFRGHPNIVELICHEGVETIGHYAFYKCPRLKRVIIPGVKTVGHGAFSDCFALIYVECSMLERIGGGAFASCKSLSSINNLQSVKVVWHVAFTNSVLTDVEFGSNLESLGYGTFHGCSLLERITLPLKEDVISNDSLFRGCDKLSQANLVEIEVLNKTIDALVMDEWRDDMNVELDSINQSLPISYAGSILGEEGDKARVIREWIERIRSKIVDYKAQHRRILNEAASKLQLSLPNDIVTKNIMTFLELPPHSFEGEIDVEGTDGMLNRITLTE